MEKIKIRQNEPKMLEYQFAARYNYNKAEKTNTILWIFCIITSLITLFPGIENLVWAKILIGIVDIVIFILFACYNSAVKNAADIRAVFDDYVLDLKSFNIDKTKKSRINEVVYKTIQGHLADAKIQMSNTGNDNPPGVKDWYEFSEDFSGRTPIMYCQKQNMWWTKKMMLAKSILFAIEVIILVVFFAIIMTISQVPLSEKILCLVGLAIKSIEHIVANLNYCICSFKIIGAFETTDENCSKDTLVKIQGLINELRTIPVLGKNFIHKKFANKLSNCFKETFVG